MAEKQIAYIELDEEAIFEILSIVVYGKLFRRRLEGHKFHQ